MYKKPIIVIGGSAGAIHPLITLLAALPAHFNAVILVVIHVERFKESKLEAILSKHSKLPIITPVNGEEIREGNVYVAPQNCLLILSEDKLWLRYGPLINHSRPAIDPLFRSAAISHYSLKSAGLLFLGSSETIGNAVDLFSIVDKRWKIFKKKGINSRFQAVLNFTPSIPTPEVNNPEANPKMTEAEPKLLMIVEKILLDNYAPACVVVDQKNLITYIHGRTGRFLEFASSDASLNILDMVRIELRSKLSSAIRKCNTQQKEVLYAGLQIKAGNEFKLLNLRVLPLK